MKLGDEEGKHVRMLATNDSTPFCLERPKKVAKIFLKLVNPIIRKKLLKFIKRLSKFVKKKKVGRKVIVKIILKKICVFYTNYLR